MRRVFRLSRCGACSRKKHRKDRLSALSFQVFFAGYRTCITGDGFLSREPIKPKLYFTFV